MLEMLTAEGSTEEYRSKVRSFCETELQPFRGRTLENETRRELARLMFDRGLLHSTWPSEVGGQGHPQEFLTVFNQEMGDYFDLLPQFTVTVGICAATLMDYGTAGQRQSHVPRMLRGDEAWTQLLSEPNAGSDLASIVSRAVPDGESFVVNGQKIWTSEARESEYALALLRTGSDSSLVRQRGVSMFIVDLRSPGIEIRPIRQMTGEQSFNEVFFDDLEIPSSSLVGELNQGWQVLHRMLRNERVALSAQTSGARMDGEAFWDLVALAKQRGVLGKAGVRSALSEVYLREQLLTYLGDRIRAALANDPEVGPIGSLGKMGVARSARTAAEAGILIGGVAGQAWRPDDALAEKFGHGLLHYPMTGIAGGTTEIQRNAVAERLLGLPREPRSS
jgi:alkylation response protein AidB-like acyl-CoA dehydrogenase